MKCIGPDSHRSCIQTHHKGEGANADRLTFADSIPSVSSPKLLDKLHSLIVIHVTASLSKHEITPLNTMEPPRYLFRTFSPGSDGSNSCTGFCSMANANGRDMITRESLSDNEARTMLTDHVLWRSWKERDDDIFISFTPSLFFALLHGLRKVETCWQTNLANCFVAIIDTSFYPAGTFSWTVDLLDRYGLDERDHRYLRRGYHTGEYLAELEVLTERAEVSVQVSLEALVNGGNLFQLWPEFEGDQCKGKLVQGLRFIRSTWYKLERPITQPCIAAARQFAQCFGGKWYLPMMVWVLASRARSSNDNRLIAEFSDGWNGIRISRYRIVSHQLILCRAHRRTLPLSRPDSRHTSRTTRA